MLGFAGGAEGEAGEGAVDVGGFEGCVGVDPVNACPIVYHNVHGAR